MISKEILQNKSDLENNLNKMIEAFENKTNTKILISKHGLNRLKLGVQIQLTK